MLPTDLCNSPQPMKRPRQDGDDGSSAPNSKRGRLDLKQNLCQSTQTSEIVDAHLQCFVHQPLQLNIASLRVVDVLPLGDDGTVHCKIRHSTLDELLQDEIGYTCLSYVWGPSAPIHWIFMNGKRFKVRKNLFDFLYVMATLIAKNGNIYRPATTGPFRKLFQKIHRPLWIDALCIDQDNNPERVHQVKSMGEVYSSAKTTIAWMGNNPELAALFASVLPESAVSTELGYHRKRHLSEIFRGHDYWNRAWITQEVLLGHERYLLAQDTFLPLEEIWGKMGNLGKTNLHDGNLEESSALGNLNTGLNNTYVRANKYVSFERGLSRDFRSFTLLENFERFQYKQCTDVRDRAYSLIYVSKGGSDLHVDYERSLVDAAKDVLRLGDDGVCFYRTSVVLQGFGILRGHAALEVDSPFISIAKSSIMRHISPCSHCGEHGNMDKFPAAPMTKVRMRCICLHCNHHRTPQDSGLHMNAHLGHLMLIQAENESSKTRLLWSPLGGGAWHEVGVHEHAKVARGPAGSMVLSLGAVCELIALLTAEEARFQPALNRLLQQTYASQMTSTWKVVS